MALGEQLPLGFEDELEGWQSIATLATVLRGRSPVYQAGSGKWTINQKCVRWGGIDISHAKEVSASWVQSIPPQYLLQEGDVVVNSTGEGTIGRTCLVTPNAVGLPFDSHVLVVRCQQNSTLPAFVAYYLRSAEGQAAIEDTKSAKTTKQTELGAAKLGEIRVPILPLPEQRRIVTRIEELAGRIERARGLRREAVQEIAAVGTAIRRTIFDEGDLSKWPTMMLGQVSEIRAGVTLGRKLSGATVRLPYLRVANVQDGRLDLRELKEIDVLADEVGKWRLEPGDILLTEGGDWDKLGRGTVWNGEIPVCIHQNHIFRVRTDPNVFEPHYLSALIGSPYGKAYFQAAAKQTTNLASINQRQLKALAVYCPPLHEQRRIVVYLDGVQARAEAVRRAQAESAAELEALLPAVLARAFRGEL